MRSAVFAVCRTVSVRVSIMTLYSVKNVDVMSTFVHTLIASTLQFYETNLVTKFDGRTINGDRCRSRV